jgi:hypothetical protein
MSRPSLVEAVFALLEKLPKWGMIVDGVLYPLRPLERCTKEIDSSLLPKDGRLWMTPKAGQCGMTARTKGRPLEKSTHLSAQIYCQMWPTPTARDWKEKGTEPSALNRNSLRLPAMTQMFPTPDANMRGAYKDAEKRKGHHFTLQDAIGSGKLNPAWVAWLMGYSTEWINLDPLAMQWFLSRRKKRSKS